MSQNSSSSLRKSRSKKGKITRNPFLNFLRDFRKNNKGLKVTQLTKIGAKVWRNMNKREKSPYYRMAKEAPKKGYRRKSHSRRSRSRKNDMMVDDDTPEDPVNGNENSIENKPESIIDLDNYRPPSIRNTDSQELKIIELPQDDGDQIKKDDNEIV
ncbi:protamine-like isoform X2 [Sitophilus oryzae]|uniref:Protamine-like isoform X1 n=1 Tax=Sitophilus oryzae TaxID=7048 RepID=A0A6J2Y0E1_SITOR|nr:protamine-like isoform X1 [Sitophilus oryzae]XP_030757183.1 protamine-like isoform X2 [Sitophilus oryzae]